MKNNWVQSSNDFYLSEISQQREKLPVNVYKINENPITKELFLTQIQEKFIFGYKIYGMEKKFIDRVAKTYKNTNGNLGILMNGTKGTGKTATAQMICNEMNLPVLIVHVPYGGISSFLNELQQDVLVFFDEYEKMYSNYDSNILTVMDGVLNNEYRKTFLLTTNTMHLNDNLLQRPGRLRYIKTFEDLTLPVIIEVIDDKLVHKQFRKECIDFISTLDTITIDIVKAVVEEVNIHEEAPENFKDVFNIKKIEDSVNLYTNKEGFGLVELKHKNVKIFPVKFTQASVDEELEIAGCYAGLIKQVIDDHTIVVELSGEYDEDFGEQPTKTKGKKNLKAKAEGETRRVETFRIEYIANRHESFGVRYAF